MNTENYEKKMAAIKIYNFIASKIHKNYRVLGLNVSDMTLFTINLRYFLSTKENYVIVKNSVYTVEDGLVFRYYSKCHDFFKVCATRMTGITSITNINIHTSVARHGDSYLCRNFGRVYVIRTKYYSKYRYMALMTVLTDKFLQNTDEYIHIENMFNKCWLYHHYRDARLALKEFVSQLNNTCYFIDMFNAIYQKCNRNIFTINNMFDDDIIINNIWKLREKYAELLYLRIELFEYMDESVFLTKFCFSLVNDGNTKRKMRDLVLNDKHYFDIRTTKYVAKVASLCTKFQSLVDILKNTYYVRNNHKLMSYLCSSDVILHDCHTIDECNELYDYDYLDLSLPFQFM